MNEIKKPFLITKKKLYRFLKSKKFGNNDSLKYYLKNSLSSYRSFSYSDVPGVPNIKIYIDNKEIDHEKANKNGYRFHFQPPQRLIFPERIENRIVHPTNCCCFFAFNNKIYAVGHYLEGDTVPQIFTELQLIDNKLVFGKSYSLFNDFSPMTEYQALPYNHTANDKAAYFKSDSRFFTYKNKLYITGLGRFGGWSPLFDEYEGYHDSYHLVVTKFTSHNNLLFSFDGNEFKYENNKSIIGRVNIHSQLDSVFTGVEGGANYYLANGFPSFGIEFNNKAYMSVGVRKDSTPFSVYKENDYSGIEEYKLVTFKDGKWNILNTNFKIPCFGDGYNPNIKFFIMDNNLFVIFLNDSEMPAIHQRITDSNWIERKDLLFYSPCPGTHTPIGIKEDKDNKGLYTNGLYDTIFSDRWWSGYYYQTQLNYFTYKNELYYFDKPNALFQYDKENKKWKFIFAGITNTASASIETWGERTGPLIIQNKLIYIYETQKTTSPPNYEYVIMNLDTMEVENRDVNFEILDD